MLPRAIERQLMKNCQDVVRETGSLTGAQIRSAAAAAYGRLPGATEGPMPDFGQKWLSLSNKRNPDLAAARSHSSPSEARREGALTRVNVDSALLGLGRCLTDCKDEFEKGCFGVKASRVLFADETQWSASQFEQKGEASYRVGAVKPKHKVAADSRHMSAISFVSAVAHIVSTTVLVQGQPLADVSGFKEERDLSPRTHLACVVLAVDLRVRTQMTTALWNPDHSCWR